MTYVKDYTTFEVLDHFKGYMNLENTRTGRRVTLASNGFIHSFDVTRFANAKVKRVTGVGTDDVTLYITDAEWKRCDLDFDCDDNGFPIGYFD